MFFNTNHNSSLFHLDLSNDQDDASQIHEKYIH